MTTTTHTPSPGRPPHSQNGAVKTGRHLYTKDAHSMDNIPVAKRGYQKWPQANDADRSAQSAAILARYGLSVADVKQQAKKEGMAK